MDSDPTVTYDRNGFEGAYDRIFGQEVYQADGNKLVAHSMRDVIVNLETAPSPTDKGADMFAVEQFEFCRVRGEWRFCFAFLE